MPSLPAANSRVPREGNALLLAGILLIALNLRPAIAAIGPLANTVRASTGFSSSVVGLLTALPLLAFGIVSLLTPLATRRFGTAAALAAGLALLSAGTVVRSLPGLFPLLGGTLLLGVGITFGNVLLPSVVKQHYTKHYGLVTSLYSAMLGLGASLAAGLSVPLATVLPGGWRGALGCWATLSLVALVAWVPQLGRYGRGPAPGRSYGDAVRKLGSSRLAWNIALYMGLQSFAFYVVLAWLPDMLQARGASPEHAGWMLSLSQFWGIIGSLSVPLWAGRQAGQRTIVITLAALDAMSLAGLLLQGAGPAGIWVSLLGFSLGGAFGLSLFMIGARSADAETAASLSGLAQSIGYLIAACGPLVAGSLFDLSGSWNATLLLLLALVAARVWAGMGAARPHLISH